METEHQRGVVIKSILFSAALAIPCCCVSFLLACLLSTAGAQEGKPSRKLPKRAGSGASGGLPKGPGLAARYPGDQGIDRNKAVVFHETFEKGGTADLGKRWTHVSNKDGKVLAFAKDAPRNSAGRRCLQMTATKGHDTGGHLWKLFKPGFDLLYARFYVKFATDHPYVHHFVKLGAWRDSPNWPKGEAGYRHDGGKSFQTGIELAGRKSSDPPGNWFLYTYWCGMRSYETPNGRGTKCYGNPFSPAEPEQAPRGKWQCVEFMLKANTAPDRHDGEQAFWIDGRLVARFAPGTPKGTWLRDAFHTSGRYNRNPKPFEGFCFRTTNELKINTFWLLYYLEAVFRKNIRPENRNIPYNSDMARVWFDDIVIATEYIGPLAGKRASKGR
jgi:hypothetical protein